MRVYIHFAGHRDDEEPHVVRTIGLWATGRRAKLSIRQTLVLPGECTRRDIAEARTRLTPSSTTIHAINGPNMVERRDLIFTLLKIPDNLGDLQVEAEKIWVLICPDATVLWQASVRAQPPPPYRPPLGMVPKCSAGLPPTVACPARSEGHQQAARQATDTLGERGWTITNAPACLTCLASLRSMFL